MPRRRTARFDFRSGVNRSFSEDVLGSREIVKARNTRLTKYGAAIKRAGTQRLHANAIGSGGTVLGLFQWDNPSQSKEIVAICAGNLYHKALGDANFTEESSSLSTSQRPWFAPYTTSGTRRLYIADGSLRKWTGTTLTTSISGAPSAIALAVYKERLFAADGTKTVYWSDIAAPETWSGGASGQANAETYDDDGVTGMAVVGGSLLIFKPNNIARYTGVRRDQIQLESETDGVSGEVGCIAPQTIVPIENMAFFLSDRGPYIATEAGVEAIGMKIENDFDAAAQDELSNAVAVHNRRRREILLMIPGSGETTNTQGWLWNYRLESWTGPIEFSSTFDVAATGRLELSDETETIMLGGYDGFVRDGDIEDVDAKDDVLSDDSGGTKITLEIEFPDLVFGDPASVKTLNAPQYIAADLKANGSLSAQFQGDQLSAQTATIASDGSGVREYQTVPGTYGRRIELTLTEATSEIVEINGVGLEAQMGRRIA